MSDPDDGFADFVLTPASEEDAEDGGTIGGTRLSAATRQRMLHQRIANPDDPPVERPRAGYPGPDFRGAPGRLAIVQGQIYIVGVILVAQLWLVTTALYELLSGNRGATLWWIALASAVGFIVALVVWQWPRRRARGG